MLTLAPFLELLGCGASESQAGASANIEFLKLKAAKPREPPEATAGGKHVPAD
jgi:hypothetical protein